MTFQELQKKIRDLRANPDAGIVPYRSCVAEMNEIADELPFYIRTLRAAFLSSFTIQGLGEISKALGIFHNLWMETYTAPYNQFTQAALDPKSDLHAFNPHVIYLILDAPDIINDAHVYDVIDLLHERTQAHIVLFAATHSPRFSDARAKEFNDSFNKTYNDNMRVSIFDFNSFLDRMGRDAVWYTKYTELGDMRIAPSVFPLLADALMAYAIATAGNTKKCAVVDLDNTLWRGIAGEDGIPGITPEKEIQQTLAGLFDKGIILAINSKNNEEDAWDVFNHPEMILQKNNFAAWRINWNAKEQNIAELAEELNLGTDSFVFIDDDPFQRECVAQTYPEIAVLTPEELQSYPGFYAHTITEEDKRRGAMYGEERQRRELKNSLRTEEDFIKELALRVSVAEVSEDTIARASQLTQKTNQFNLTTRRYSEDAIRACMQNGWHVWTVGVNDRFGDYGITGLLMIEPGKHTWRVDTFLLSCRVLGRGVEHQIINHLFEVARAQGIAHITAEYCRSAKNKQTENFWDSFNFRMIAEEKDKKYYLYEI